MDAILKRHNMVRAVNAVLGFALVNILFFVFFSEKPGAGDIKETRSRLAGREITERCVTCHDPQQHSIVPGHAVTGEPCTACHDGSGLGVTPETAHLFDQSMIRPEPEKPMNWRQALRAEPLIQGLPEGFKGEHAGGRLAGADASAACVRCHSPLSLPAELSSVKGYRAFTELGCGQCHTVPGVSTGSKGPGLGKAGDLLSLDTLRRRVSDPQPSVFYSVMPTYDLQEQEVSNLALFLKGQSKTFLRPVGYDAARKDFGSPLADSACVGCHKIGSSAGTVAPDLDRLAAQRDKKWTQTFLSDPDALRPGLRMPAVLGKQIQAVADELYKPRPAEEIPQDPALAYKTLCARCHGEEGDGWGPIAHNLMTSPRTFKENPGYFMLRGQEALSRSIAAGIPGTSMPAFEGVLGKQRTVGVLDFALSRFAWMDPGDYVEDLPVPARIQPGLGESEAVYAKHCQRCHGASGDLGATLLRPRYPQARNFQNTAFMDSLDDNALYKAVARGVPGTRMGAYQAVVPGTGAKVRQYLSDGEVWAAVSHVRRLANEHR